MWWCFTKLQIIQNEISPNIWWFFKVDGGYMIEKNNQGIYQHSPGLLQVPAVVTHTLNFFLPVNLPKHSTPLSQPAYLYQISSPPNNNSLPTKTRSTVPTLSPLCHYYRHPIPAPSQTLLSPTAPPPPFLCSFFPPLPKIFPGATWSQLIMLFGFSPP